MTRGVYRYLYRAIFTLLIAFLASPALAGEARNRENKIFLASSINNSHPYVGQETVLTYTLYFKETAPKISNETIPLLRGVWAKETPPERYIQSIPALFQGGIFRSAVIKQFRLVPLQSGEITVAGYSIVCTQPQEQIPDGAKDVSDTRLRITAPQVIISAQALPEPVPEGFAGAIGTFQLNLLANKKSIKAGEPLILKLLLSGTGSLLTLKLPDLHLPASFRQNPPEITTTLKANALPTTGSITATTVAWPPSVGDYQLPSVQSVVFNPETKQFDTIFTKPLTITVTPAAQRTTSSGVLPPTVVPEQETTFSIQLIIAAIALLLASAFVVIRKQTNTAKKTQLHGKEKMQTESGRSAASLKQQLFVELENSGIKSPGGLTRVELNHALHEIGIPDNVQLEFTALLDTLDKILYTPAGAKQGTTSDSIAAKVNTLSIALKNAAGSQNIQ